MKHTDLSDPTPATPVTDHDSPPAGTHSARWLFLAVFALVALWGTAIAIWGIPGLYIPALATVPLIFLTLVYVSRG